MFGWYGCVASGWFMALAGNRRRRLCTFGAARNVTTDFTKKRALTCITRSMHNRS